MRLGYVLQSCGLASAGCAAAYDRWELSSACIKESAGLTLNVLILAGALIVKTPQLLNVFIAKSASGLSYWAILTEVFTAELVVGYNLLSKHPFSTWGEAVFIGAQNLVLLLLYCMYTPGSSSKRQRGLLLLLSSALLLLASYKNLLSPSACAFIHRSVGLVPMALMCVSRLPQILLNMRQQHTGHLSLLSSSLASAGAAARLATVIQQVPDKRLLATASVSLVMNLIPTAQILMYWESTNKVLREEKEKRLN